LYFTNMDLNWIVALVVGWSFLSRPVYGT